MINQVCCINNDIRNDMQRVTHLKLIKLGLIKCDTCIYEKQDSFQESRYLYYSKNDN